MANNRRKRASYSIEKIVYTKKPTGQMNKYGNKEYETVGEPKRTRMNNTNFNELKKKIYEESKKNNNVYVDYSKPVYRITKCRPRVKSVTVTKTDGTKTVTYYNAVKGKA